MSREISIKIVPEETEDNAGFRWKIIRSSAGVSMDAKGHDSIKEIGCIDATITIYGEDTGNEGTLKLLKELLLSHKYSRPL